MAQQKEAGNSEYVVGDIVTGAITGASAGAALGTAINMLFGGPLFAMLGAGWGGGPLGAVLGAGLGGFLRMRSRRKIAHSNAPEASRETPR